MRYYFNLDEFYRAVDERIETGRCTVPKLYRATAELDKDFKKETSSLWLLDKLYGKDKGGVEFETYEDAQRALSDHFYEAVADKEFNL